MGYLISFYTMFGHIILDNNIDPDNMAIYDHQYAVQYSLWTCVSLGAASPGRR